MFLSKLTELYIYRPKHGKISKNNYDTKRNVVYVVGTSVIIKHKVYVFIQENKSRGT